MIISMENCLLLSIALADIDLRSFSSVINSFICLIYSDISSLGIANPLTLSVIMSVNEAKLRKAKGTQPYNIFILENYSPNSAFGGIIAFNRELDAETAQAIISRQFVEVIIAPSASEEALKITAYATCLVCRI